jgi:3-oxoacyl-(acyl-carrier-protein) synthase
LAAVGLAEEPSLGAQPAEPNLGKAINSAIDRAVADAKLPNALFAALVHDLPSSQAGFAELAWVKGCPSLRTSPEVQIVSPPFSTGATGAASGILSLVTLAFLIEKQVIADPGLCLFAAEGTSRGVAILTPPPHRKVARR